MFTGIVQEVGCIEFKKVNSTGIEFQIKASLALIERLKLGDSVSVNGVCQTVTKIQGEFFYIQAVKTTLSKTTMKSLNHKALVNLETAAKVGDAIGGHMMTGHINGMGKLVQKTPQGKGLDVWISIPSDLEKYVVKEGSIAIDGVSLTVADERSRPTGYEVMISLIPHTLEETKFQRMKLGDIFNIEVDMIAKYIEKMSLAFHKGSKKNHQKWIGKSGRTNEV